MSTKASNKTKAKINSSKAVAGLRVETTAVVNQLLILAHKDKLSFTSMNLVGEQNTVVADLIKHETPIILTIGLDGPPDRQFPDIQQDCLLKAFKIAQTCDAPTVVNVQFTSDQVTQLAGYIRGAHEVRLVIEQKPKERELFDETDGVDP